MVERPDMIACIYRFNHECLLYGKECVDHPQCTGFFKEDIPMEEKLDNLDAWQYLFQNEEHLSFSGGFQGMDRQEILSLFNELRHLRSLKLMDSCTKEEIRNLLLTTQAEMIQTIKTLNGSEHHQKIAETLYNAFIERVMQNYVFLKGV